MMHGLTFGASARGVFGCSRESDAMMSGIVTLGRWLQEDIVPNISGAGSSKYDVVYPHCCEVFAITISLSSLFAQSGIASKRTKMSLSCLRNLASLVPVNLHTEAVLSYHENPF